MFGQVRGRRSARDGREGITIARESRVADARTVRNRVRTLAYARTRENAYYTARMPKKHETKTRLLHSAVNMFPDGVISAN